VRIVTTRVARTAVQAVATALLLLASCQGRARAQSLEPRLYAPSPVGIAFCGASVSRSTGSVVTDPSLPIENVDAKVLSAYPNCGLTFALFGRQASAVVVVPYVDADVEGDVFEEYRSVTRSGLGDVQLRLGVNLVGGPALDPRAFARAPHRTALGASLVVVAPTGEYFPDKLVNIGTNRWAVKPELGLTHPVGRWSLELFAGVWFYSDNDEFYGGTVRKQDPLGVVQGHVVYAITPRAWVALDGTYYSGGQTSVDGGNKEDRQSNTRAGVTGLFPVSRHQAIRVAWAKGVNARSGSRLDTLLVGWQYSWFVRPKGAPPAAGTKRDPPPGKGQS
jgi:hypothetical protein